MKNLTVKLKGKTYEGAKAVQVLVALLSTGATLGERFTDVEELPQNRILWTPIRKNREEIGVVSWPYLDQETSDLITALEIGGEIAVRLNSRKKAVKLVTAKEEG